MSELERGQPPEYAGMSDEEVLAVYPYNASTSAAKLPYCLMDTEVRHPPARRVTEEDFDPVRTALYRHFDNAARLLYVGISLSVVHRLAAHNHRSHWSEEIATVTVEYFPSRTEAVEAEAVAIAYEQPLHNKKGRGS